MNAVRLLEKDFAISAVLLEEITYIKFDEEIMVPKNTYIIVDTENNTALIGIDHVFIEPNEYKIISC